MIIIQLGHYQTKSSLGSERAEIVKIIGENKQRPGYWLTIDGESIPEYILVENYVPIVTSHSPEKQKQLPASLFEGLSEISDTDIIEDKNSDKIPPQVFTKAQGNNLEEVQKSIEQNIPIQPKTVIKEVPINFDKSILDKLNIDKINKSHSAQFGELKYHEKPKVTINLPIEFNYDLNKLKSTIALLELDTHDILNYLVSEISVDDIRRELKQQLFNIFDSESNESHFLGNIGLQRPKPIEIPQTYTTEPIIETNISAQLLEKEQTPVIEQKIEIYVDPTKERETPILTNTQLEEELIKMNNYINNFYGNERQ